MIRKTMNYRDGKQGFQRITGKGDLMGICATLNRKYLCCSVHVLRSVHNCPFDCSYCFLQDYLNDGMTKVVCDSEGLMKVVKEKTAQQPWRLFRIGTWELGDSLALEHDTGQAESLVNGFGGLRNAVLELKTKSDCVDTLLRLDHRGKTVVSWSLNTDVIISTEEHGTSALHERLHGIYKAAQADYLIGLHFDPLILHKGWEEGYTRLVRQVFESVNPDRVAWISMGSLRFHPGMKKKIENNYPDSRITGAEMVLGDDMKVRYVKPLRTMMYSLLYGELKKYVREGVLIYLCMERWDVWNRIFGLFPRSIGHVDYLFARSLKERFGLGPDIPDSALYEKIHQQDSGEPLP